MAVVKPSHVGEYGQNQSKNQSKHYLDRNLVNKRRCVLINDENMLFKIIKK